MKDSELPDPLSGIHLLNWTAISGLHIDLSRAVPVRIRAIRPLSDPQGLAKNMTTHSISCAATSPWAGRLLALALTALVTACGGGSEGNDIQEPAAPLQVNGAATETGRMLDLAIDGDGMFVLQGLDGTLYYTRYGRFDVDASGNLVHSSGLFPIGRASVRVAMTTPDQRLTSIDHEWPKWPITRPSEGLSEGVSDYLVPISKAAPLPTIAMDIAHKATSSIYLQLNLDARSSVTQFVKLAHGFNPSVSTSDNYVLSQAIYDSGGNEIILSYCFQKRAVNTWDVYILANGVLLKDATFTLAFAGDGTDITNWGYVINWGQLHISVPVTPLALGGTSFPIDEIAINVSASQFRSPFESQVLDQNGWLDAGLDYVFVRRNGELMLSYQNGKFSYTNSQLLLAKFSAADRLTPVGDGLYRCAAGCQAPMIAPPMSHLLGEIRTRRLESA